MLGRYCKNKSHTRTIIKSIKIVANELAEHTKRNHSTYGDDRNKLRRLSQVRGRMSWSFLWVGREMGTMGNYKQTGQQNRERDTEYLYNTLNSLFLLINVRANLNVTSSESIGSPYYAAICQFSMNKIQQHQCAICFVFFNSTTTSRCQLLLSSHFIILMNQHLI